ncbi:MAG: glycosyltransferase [Thermodesulfobacteriota bacterium]
MTTLPENAFVFLDPRGKRWPRLRLVLVVSSLLVLLAAVLFVRTLFITPALALPRTVLEMKARLHMLAESALPPASPPLWLRFTKPGSKAVSAGQPDGDDTAPVRLAFVVDWDQASLASAAAHAGEITHLCPEYLSLGDGEGRILQEPRPRVLDLAQDRELAVLPLLTNLLGNAWQPEAVEGLAAGPVAAQERFVADLAERLQEIAAAGVLVEWGQLDPAYRAAITGLLARMAQGLHEEGLELWLNVPVGLELKALDLEALAPVVDRFVARLHDENGEEDLAGPIASRAWLEGWLDTLLGYGRPGQWVIALGAYGYDWIDGQARPEPLSFAEVMTRAGRAGVVGCDSDDASGTPHFSYDDSGVSHTVWFLDAATMLSQARAALARQVGGLAITRLGTEDPGIWPALGLAARSALAPEDLAGLADLTADGPVAHLGSGEFLRLEENPANGRRALSLAADGWVIAHYQRFPSYRTVLHQGQGRPDEVAISFDDGPDPRYTPAILDLLAARGVKAAFFLLGNKMEEHPELVRRIVAEGHEVGLHTYSHPDLAEVSGERAELELNASQRLLESLTGRSTILFRPPYHAAPRPMTGTELAPIRLAQALGYLTVMSSIDTEDWTRPGVEAMVTAVKRQRGWGQIILLHDAGGDREQTVAALPAILDYLQERGDRVVSLATLLGQPAATVMPPVPAGEDLLARLVTGTGFAVLRLAGELFWAFMVVATGLVVLRTGIVCALAVRHWRRQRAAPPPPSAFQPPVSVLMAAYNEEKVIGRTLAALLATDYPGDLEVIVVDDGSGDRTGEVVQEWQQRDPRIRLLTQSNQGKARALRHGLAAARHEIVVTLDADTQFAAQTIRQLVQPLADARVAAVSGHARVGNPTSFISRCQDLEYLCGFNLDRRAFQEWNCVTVVPGAVGALRRAAVLAAGGISPDTLAEDTDLTLTLHRHGQRIAYVPEALAWTEAPLAIGALACQRFRWAFGVLQCLWKHRDLVFHPRAGALGWFALPGIWFFQILLVAVGPVADVLLLGCLLTGAGGSIYLYFLVFLAMDLILAALACFLEGEPLARAWRMVPMRLVYRPLLAWVVWRAVLRAVQGVWVGGGKLERTATVTARA